jgi:hypothetical protein
MTKGDQSGLIRRNGANVFAMNSKSSPHFRPVPPSNPSKLHVWRRGEGTMQVLYVFLDGLSEAAAV